MKYELTVWYIAIRDPQELLDHTTEWSDGLALAARIIDILQDRRIAKFELKKIE